MVSGLIARLQTPLPRFKTVERTPGRILCNDVSHLGHGRPVLQPALEFAESGLVTASKHFDVAVIKIYGVAGQAERISQASRISTEKHALHAASYRETTGAGHATELRGFFVAAFTPMQRVQRLFLGLQRIATRVFIAPLIQIPFRTLQMFHCRTQLSRCVLGGTGVTRNGNRLASVTHFLNRRSRAAGYKQQRAEQSSRSETLNWTW